MRVLETESNYTVIVGSSVVALLLDIDFHSFLVQNELRTCAQRSIFLIHSASSSTDLIDPNSSRKVVAECSCRGETQWLGVIDLQLYHLSSQGEFTKKVLCVRVTSIVTPSELRIRTCIPTATQSIAFSYRTVKRE